MYAKIFRQIFDSSIAEKPELRFTFMDLIVLADSDGVVDMTQESIARTTNRPLELIRSTIAELEGPDPRSRTADENGARLKRLDEHRDWGWIILNFDKFRGTATDIQRREKTKLRTRKYRQNLRENSNVTQCDAGVTQCDAGVTPPYAYASASASVPEKGGTGGKMPIPSLEEVRLFCSKSGISVADANWFFYKMDGNGWTNGGKPVKRWTSSLLAWKTAGYLASQRPQRNGSPNPAQQSSYADRALDRLYDQIMKENKP
jgi:hypothetical protein